MKRLYSIAAAVLLLGAATPLTQAETRVSVDFFHDNLESYGDWREVGDYGYCWQPRDVDPDWRPYSDGRWIYTDAGWTWDSDEPYSWAVYHYGRWARVERIGWVWVPGTEWGPAWVSWRRSSRHVGWAPLPPEARFTRSVGFSTRVDADYDIGPTNYRFVEVRNFGAPRLRTVFIEPRENITIIRQTTNITRITYVNNVVYNEGPQYEVISRESAQPIRRLRLERREELGGDPRTVRAEQLRSTVEGDSFRVMAIPFDTKPAAAPKKVAAKVEKVEVDRGWKNAGPAAEVAKVRTQIKSEPAASAEVSPNPKTEKTAEAAVPSSAPGEKPAKGKVPAAREPAIATTPDKTEVAPPPAGKPAASATAEVAPPSPAKPTAPVTTEVAPPSPGKPVAADQSAKPGKPDKEAKPVRSEPRSVRPPPPAVEEPAPSSQSKKGRDKGSEEKAPGAKPKSESVEPKRTQPPGVEEAAPSSRSKKGKDKGSDAARPPVEAAPERAPLPKKQSVEPPRNPPAAEIEKPRQNTRPDKGDGQPKREQPAAPSVEHKIPTIPESRPPTKRPEPKEQAAPAPTQAQPPEPAKTKGKDKDKEEKK